MFFIKMVKHFWIFLVVYLNLINFNDHMVKAELTPPYFNLAEGRKISSTATCGVDTDGPELYCKLVGANTENDNQFYSLIQGQVCDYCDPTRPDRNHPPEYAIDGTENWWQSPPLSRGMKYNEVNLTIDFGQEFHVAYLFIRMGNSPRPGLWTLEKSSDYGKTWKAWQHFSDTPADCETYFGRDSLRPIMSDDDVICTTEYSKIVPLENGEIPVMLLNNRPSANNYFNSTVLQEWTRATNVRFRFLRTKNLLGHLMSVARQDPTVTRRYFYSIKDISIGGRCMCNGHADTCHVLDPLSPTRILACQCRHNTCGIQCADCCPGYEQKKWHQNTNARPFQCEPCNCHGHSNTCVYKKEIDEQSLSLDIHGKYEGGGECQNCQHNTEGINCNKCKPTFYRPYGKYWNETDVCTPCDCNNFYSTGNCAEETGQCECRIEYEPPYCQSCSYGYFGYPSCRQCECFLNGTNGYHCEATYGKCPCKSNFAGDYCKECSEGYYNFPKCEACECNQIGSLNDVCDYVSGQCPCSSNFDGRHCDQCKNGYYNYPNCKYCSCEYSGTIEEVCDKGSGQCLCKEGYGGPRCDQCIPGYYNYPDCVPCNCSTLGSVSTVCDQSGKCPCLSNYSGKQCTMCSTGYYAYPECLPCNCDVHGSNGISCNSDGQCLCSSNFDGKICDLCKEGFYNFPLCEECNCDPAGVIAKFAGCGSVPAGELCRCKERVTGRICDQCKPLYWNLNISNPLGCEECDCFLDGTIGGLDTCDSKSGQCSCKVSVGGRSCGECKDGSFDLFGGSLFGCKDCGCDIGGSVNGICDKTNGQCKCHPRVAGRTCTQPLTTHYYPTLYQFQFEYEDGYTPSGANVRYQFDEFQFPNFSKRGYAKFSTIQSEVINEVNIFRSSVYRMVIRYVNPTNENIVAEILITSDNPSEVDQKAKVLFKPTAAPEFVTVSGSKGEIPSAIVLDPGRYTISIKTDKYLFLDYFVLLPAAYYEASILTRKIENPCEIGGGNTVAAQAICRHYKYPSLIEFNPAGKNEAFITENNKAYPPNEFYTDAEHLGVIQEHEELPEITPTQRILNYIVDVRRSGPYILVVDYITNRANAETYMLQVDLAGEPEKEGIVSLYPCVYTTICRQPVIDVESREKIFYFDKDDLRAIEVVGDEQTHVAIKSITAIPLEEWSLDLITPASVCIMKDNKCVPSTFRSVPDSKKIEFEIDNEFSIIDGGGSTTAVDITYPIDLYDNATKLIYLNQNSSTIEIQSKVSSPGRYYVIVQFYQPNHPQFDVHYKIRIEQEPLQPPTSSSPGSVQPSPPSSSGVPSLQYDGKFPVRNCPSNSGCRQLIKQDNDYRWFDIEEGITMTFTNPLAKGVWFDYVLLVPADQYHENLLREDTFDQTKEFIQRCGQDHFDIKLNSTEFCKQAVFSLTADYNSGALQCNCDYSGSTSFECDPFGGQCQCKPHVIGRQCEACKTGFYGFPECKPCDCPSTALCEKDTGECICPPRVTGEKCDKCEAFTFGFDQIIGCELCNCNPMGVERNNLQCDLNNGTCQCRPHIEGRTCDKCINGFFNFPHCEPCRCSAEGTTFEICDQQDETCFCKKNVIGKACDQCVDGTYNLNQANPDGCTKCFCFGRTSRCDRAFLRSFNVSMLKDITVQSIKIIDAEAHINPILLSDNELYVNDSLLELRVPAEVLVDTNDNDDGKFIYFGFLDYLLDQNNHLSAYGGYLTYTIYYTKSLFGNAYVAPDVILEGKDMVIVHQSYEQPAIAQNFYGSVKMIESNFRTISGAPVTRDQFMIILRDLNSIYVRASYFEQTILTRLADVYLTMADDDEENYKYYEELSVERCQCPPGYKGLSCEDCAPGYYRDKTGPYGGYCVPCQCNGHADTCDCNTGICDACKHYTTGDHCELCIEGYHGNATFGTPHDCMICACPMPIETNNFATSCEISEDGYKIHCVCRTGYTGARCQSCAAGYYGNPEIEGEFCRPCQCSGNINPEEPGSCDSVTGECKLCLNNTSGAACNLCAPGYYGDAIKLKDCQSCICDDLGTEFCDSFVGTCHCYDNVIGDKCDRCVDDHYGFDTGRGCSACDCAISSNSTQCDDHTGECRCKPGVTGRQCDRCLPGYWNYTVDGCLPCSCNTDYSRGLGCNAQTGQCECLPGVVGEKCDACPYRWVLISDIGCEQCDICHHALLDVTDSMRSQLDPVILDFNTVAGGYFTAQKLNYYNDLVDKIEPDVKALDPNGVNLTPLHNQIDALESDLRALVRRANYANETAAERAMGSRRLINESASVLDAGRLVGNNVRNTVREVKQLADSFDASESTTKIDKAIEEAEQIVKNLKEYESDTDANSSDNQFRTVRDFMYNITVFNLPISEQYARLEYLRNGIGNFSDKMEDLYDWSEQTNAKAMEAELGHLRNRDAMAKLKFETVANQSRGAQQNIDDIAVLSKKGDITLGEIMKQLNKMDEVNSQLKKTNRKIDKLLPLRENEYEELTDLIEQATINQNKLIETAKEIGAELSNITANSEQALKAANAYTDIGDAVKDAREFIRMANNATGHSYKLCDGMCDERAIKSRIIAGELLGEARSSLQTVQDELQPHVNQSAEKVAKIIRTNELSDKQNTAINDALDNLRIESQQSDVWQGARDKAIAAEEQAQDALGILEPIVKNLSNDLENSKQMPKKFADAIKDIDQATGQINRVGTQLPIIESIVDELTRKQDEIDKINSDLGERMERLRRQIEMARDVANGIKVGVNFHPNTTLELQPPKMPEYLSTNSRVSAYIKTDKPNGFLMYFGNENSTNVNAVGGSPSSGSSGSGSSRPHHGAGKHNDFIALEIENGYPILTMDLGTKPQKIISNKNVADGKWHQIIAERTGPIVKLIVREQLDDGREQIHEVEDQISGPNAEFNVDKENSKLFVGGYPPDFNLHAKGLKYSSFEGQIEDLRIGDEEIGLWNFLDGQDNNHGAIERDLLIASETPSTGYRFSGQGYAILNATPYTWKMKSSIQFKFKAGRDTEDGLMFYAGKNRHFISVEMRSGGIYFQYKLGQHLVSIGSDQMFNDDRWHMVEAERLGKTGVLKVDGMDIYKQETADGTEENLKVSDTMYFGGHPGKINHSEVTTRNFDGCIDDVYISGRPVDLSNNMNAYGVRQGCPAKFSAILSFKPEQFGYLRRGNVSAINHFQLNLKFKTIQSQGIIFYASNYDQSATIGLTISNRGSLVLKSMGTTVSSRDNKYNDGEWHVVTAIRDAKNLRMIVDETKTYTENILSSKPFTIQYGDIYFGGLPKGFKTPAIALPTTAYFTGCISDVLINGQIVNFANSTDRNNTILDNCSRDIFDYDVSAVKIFYPDESYRIDKRIDVDKDFTTTEEEDEEEGGEGEDEDEAEEAAKRKEQQEKEDKAAAAERKRMEEEEEEEAAAAKEAEENAKNEAEEEKIRQLAEKERERERERIEEEEAERERLEKQREFDEQLKKEMEKLHPTVSQEPITTTTTKSIISAIPTTTQRTPTRPKPTIKQNRICKLPVEPEVDVDFDAGYRFGTTDGSRIEFTQIPAKLKKAYEISFNFKTMEPHGMMFYVADGRHTDFIGLHMENGRLIHSFNGGSGKANMTSLNTYNDGKWYSVIIIRQQNKGRLIVDGEDITEGESQNNTRTMAIQPPFSFGNVRRESAEDMYINLKLDKGTYFSGCIRNIQMAGRPLGEPAHTIGVSPCSDAIEQGIFFGKGNGYVKLRDRFKVGTELTIQFDIKPRTLNGLLLSVHGKKAYLILQLINGTIHFTVDNGDGPIVAQFIPDPSDNFCDGEWRTITAIKSQYVITLMVNALSSQPSIGSATSPSTDTSRPLFLGGHPHLQRARGLKIREPYQGCIRNVRIRDVAENITPNMLVGNVRNGVCPTI